MNPHNHDHPAGTALTDIGALRILCDIYWPGPFEAAVDRLFTFADEWDGTRRARVAAELGLAISRFQQRLNRRHADLANTSPELLDQCCCIHARGAHLTGRWCTAPRCHCTRYHARRRRTATARALRTGHLRAVPRELV
jgi:hypothetical protein